MIVNANIAFMVDPYHPLQGQARIMDCPMNILPRDKQIAVISALTEGCSIRATERLTSIHRDTIMRLGVRVGDGCAELHDEMMRFVQVNRLELDEMWSFVGKKQRRVKQTDPADLVERAFGVDCTFAQVIKQYHGEPAIDTARRYSPGVVVGVQRRWVIGAQRKVCTSYVERGNLSVRMGSRRFTRLTNAFSKKLANHVAAVSLYVAHFNLCRVHESLRITPAMAMGITDHIWTIGELLDVATAEPTEQLAV
jgi:hypothetical protein